MGYGGDGLFRDTERLKLREIGEFVKGEDACGKTDGEEIRRLMEGRCGYFCVRLEEEMF